MRIASLAIIAALVLPSAGEDAPEPLPDPPTVSAAVDGAQVVATLRNVAGVPIRYRGYSREDFQYFQEERGAGGAWKRTRWAWCGTGLGDHEIAPGAERVFRFAKPEVAGPVRVGTYVRDDAGAEQPVWFWQSP